MTHNTIKRAIMWSCLIPACMLHAQDDEDDEVFTLSPFTVDGSTDSGYNASQTMAGGRLNQSLKDTGAAIQVITVDFMNDIGATGVEELLQYTTSSEVAGILGNFTGADDGGEGEVSTGGARREPDGRSRVRGLAAPDRSRNFYVTDIPFDSYNTERIDINRGANSFLFGLGSPAGLINNGLAQAQFRDTNEITFRVGSGGEDPTMRGTFKVNRVLAEDKFAVTVAGLMDRTEYRQRPTYKDDDRIYTTFTFRPFGDHNTVIKGHFESGEIVGNAPDVLLPQENLSTFLDYPASFDVYENLQRFNHPEGPNANMYNNERPNGTPRQARWVTPEERATWPTYTDANGVEQPFIRDSVDNLIYRNIRWGAGAYGFVYDGSEGREPAFAYTDEIRGADYNRRDPFWDPNNYGKGKPERVYPGNLGEINGTGWLDQGFTDLETFDFSRYNLGWDNDFYSRDFTNHNVSIEKIFWEGKAGITVGYDYQDLYRDNYTAFNGANSVVTFDVNEVYLLPTEDYLNGGEATAVPNPNYGRPVILTKSGRTTIDEQRETFRFTGFVKHDFRESLGSERWGSILGDHTLTILGDSNVYDEMRTSFVTNSFGDPEPALHIGPANARQSANNARNVPNLVYIGPAQTDAFNGGWSLSDFELDVADYQLLRPEGYTTSKISWNLGPDANESNLGLNSRINGDESWVEGVFAPTEVPTKNYRLQQTEVTSLAANSQSRFFDGNLIVNMGYREDTVDNWLNTEARFVIERADANGNFLTHDQVIEMVAAEPEETRAAFETELLKQISPNEIADLSPQAFLLENGNYTETVSSTFGYGGVLYWPKNIIKLPEFVDDITFHYNESDNFIPAADRVDELRKPVPSPQGISKDWGVSFYLMKNKVVARLNWYEATLAGATASVSNNYNQNITNMFSHWSNLNRNITQLDSDGDRMIDQSVLDEFSEGFDPDAVGMTLEEAIAVAYPSLEESYAARDAIAPFLTDELKVAYNWRLNDDGSANTQWAGSITDTQDIAAEGMEAEIIYNPTKNWRIAFNAAKTETVLTNIAPRLTDLLNDVWIPHLAEYGDLDWNNPVQEVNGNTTQQQVGDRLIDYFALKGQEGKPSVEQREWRFNFITNYNFREGALKGFSVGGAARWQDEYAGGFPLLVDEETGLILPDVDNPWMADSDLSLDLTLGYSRKIFDNKVNWRMQLNLRNIHNWDNTDIDIVRYQPDGTAARARYAPPRQVLLTNTFRF